MTTEFESSILKFQGLGLKGLGFGGLDPIGPEFESLVSNPSVSDLRLGLGGSGLEMFLGFDFLGLWLELVNQWAYQRLIHDPTILLVMTWNPTIKFRKMLRSQHKLNSWPTSLMLIIKKYIY
jgi:hypothetical protein